MAKSEIPADRVEAYDRLIAAHPEIERKGKTMPYTSVNGHMFTHMDKTGTMGIRLPEDERQAFMEKFDSGPYIQYGKTMRGYAVVPVELLLDTDRLLPYLEKSYAYVSSLKPKPTTRKKKK